MSPTRGRKTAAAEGEPEPAAQPAHRALGKRVARSIYLTEDLLERARAASAYLSMYKPEAGIRSLSDIFIPGGWAEVERLEKEHNHGKPFRKVAKMPTGRPLQAD